MYSPRPEPRSRSAGTSPTWRSILAGYLLVAGLLVGLWVASYPVFGTIALASAAGLAVLGRRATGLLSCLAVCRELTVAPGGAVAVTICRSAADCRSDDPT